MPLGKGQYFHDGIHLPFLGRGILFTSHAYLVGKLLLEVAIRYQQVVEKLLGDAFNVLSIGNLEEKVQSFLLDDQIMIFKTVSDCLLVSLHRIVINVNDALE